MRARGEFPGSRRESPGQAVGLGNRISNPAERGKYPIYPALAGGGVSNFQVTPLLAASFPRKRESRGRKPAPRNCQPSTILPSFPRRRESRRRNEVASWILEQVRNDGEGANHILFIKKKSRPVSKNIFAHYFQSFIIYQH